MTLQKIIYRVSMVALLLVGLNSCEDIVDQESNETVLSMPVTNSKLVKSLTLNVGTNILNKEDNTTISLKATYKDGTSKILTKDITWVMEPSRAVNIIGNKITALKEGNVTIQAKVGNVRSNKINVGISWTINGYKLPPEPDPVVNNTTLLGIDSNHNGVRDDVERWIYITYKDKHPIYVDIAMQAVRAYKQVLETPERAKEIHEEVRKSRHCEYYYKYDASEFNETILIDSSFDRGYLRDKIYFNTKVRQSAYNHYDMLLSGDSYTLPSPQEEKDACAFNTAKYEE